MSTIITIDELKQYLGITESDDATDGQLESILEDLPSYIKLKTGRWFGCTEEVTEPHDYADVIFLDHLDVDSITWIKSGYSNDHDYEDDTSLRLLDTSDYRWNKDTGRILLTSGYSRNRSRNDYDQIVVKYKFGTTTVPGDIKLAAKEYAGSAFRGIDGEVSSASLGAYKLTYKESKRAQEIFEDNRPINL